MKKEKPLKAKKWREVDKKNLTNRIKEKYLTIMKMRLNLINVDPMIQEHKRYQREVRRIQKSEDKRKKQEQAIKQQQEIRSILKERETQAMERGLRNRIKPEDEQMGDEEKPVELVSPIPQMEDLEAQEELQVEIKQEELETEVPEQIQMELSEPNQPQMDVTEQNPTELPTESPTVIKDEDFDLQAEERLNSEILNHNLQGIEDNGRITLNLQADGTEEPDTSFTPCEGVEMPELRELPAYFKHSNPLTICELDWLVTLSRNDFPWNEICFEPFSAKECYKMYRTMVKDAASFLKKVLGEKMKYQRMMNNQL